MYQRSDLLTLDELGEVAFLIHIKYDYRHIALAAESKSRLIHYLQSVLDGLVECEFVIFHCCRILLRIGSIDSVNARTLQESIGSDLKGP